MPSLYPLGIQKILLGEIDLEDDTIELAWVTADFEFDATDEFYSAVSSDVVDSVELTTRSVDVAGDNSKVWFDSDDATSVGLVGDDVAGYVIWQNTGNPATSPLLYHTDEDADTSAIDASPDGNDLRAAPVGAGWFAIACAEVDDGS